MRFCHAPSIEKMSAHGLLVGKVAGVLLIAAGAAVIIHSDL